MNKNELYEVFRSMPVLTTERLVLRAMSITDVDDMYDYARRSEVCEYLLWRPHPSREYTCSYLEHIQNRYAMGDFYDWAIVFRESGKMIGTAGFTRIDAEHNRAEVGYVINPDFWGQGIAAEAVRAVIDFGFNTLSLHRIEARFMQENKASVRVMEKLGMSFEGLRRDSELVKGRYRTVGYCSILQSEFYKKQDSKSGGVKRY